MECSNIFNDWFICCNGLESKIVKNFELAFYSWLYSLQIINEIWTSKLLFFIVSPTFLFTFLSRQEPTFPRWFYIQKKRIFLCKPAGNSTSQVMPSLMSVAYESESLIKSCNLSPGCCLVLTNGLISMYEGWARWGTVHVVLEATYVHINVK